MLCMLIQSSGRTSGHEERVYRHSEGTQTFKALGRHSQITRAIRRFDTYGTLALVIFYLVDSAHNLYSNS